MQCQIDTFFTIILEYKKDVNKIKKDIGPYSGTSLFNLINLNYNKQNKQNNIFIVISPCAFYQKLLQEFVTLPVQCKMHFACEPIAS